MSCITPSHPVAIPYGESLDIFQLLRHPGAGLGLGTSLAGKWPYETRKRVLADLHPNLDYLAAQISPGESPFRQKRIRSTKTRKGTEI